MNRYLYASMMMLSIYASSLSLPDHLTYIGWDHTQSLHGIKVMESGDGLAPEKYFREAAFNIHYDGRFGLKQLPYYGQKSRLSTLIRAYFITMDTMGVESWLMHGSLLGWYWGRKIFPWDSDNDVQVLESTMKLLAESYDMTVHRFELPTGEIREFLLEINPNWINSSTADAANAIDARWLDTATGLYVDITVLRMEEDSPLEGATGMLFCKDGHRYLRENIFPLRHSQYEGTPARVPFAYATVLTEEYGKTALVKSVYNSHQFDARRQEWLPLAEWWF